MIAHFALMGDLYQYDPYETEASLWNSYPWQIGLDNNLSISSTFPSISMSKMIWDIDDSDSSIGAVGANISSFGMFAALILADNFGNYGDAVGDDPNPIPNDFISILSGVVTSISSRAVIIYANTNTEMSEDLINPITTLSGAVTSVSSRRVIIYANTNTEMSEDLINPITTLSGTVTSVTSNLT